MSHIEEKKMLKVAVGWSGLPAYAARLLKAGREKTGINFPVIGTYPDIPIKGMDEILGGNLYWIKANQSYSWASLGLEVPEIFFHSGWGLPHFLSLANEVRSNGGKVVGMFDNCWKSNSRQIFGGLYFRAFMRRQYSKVMVPGKSGRRLARFIGFKDSDIFEGMYAADPNIFSLKKPIEARKKNILFVGRFIKRKGVEELLDGFNLFSRENPDWSLTLVGEGNLKIKNSLSKYVSVIPFQQPYKIAELLNESKVFILPSHEEHWGLVVHEAALCGCFLILNRGVGSAQDLCNKSNSFLLKNTCPVEVSIALSKLINLSPEDWDTASSSSLLLSRKLNPNFWSEQFESILNSLH
jgi:glycosyltransferase involved in cell wall biosynthesis